MEGTLTFLGTGTSMGVPSLGCSCAVCTSNDPHDKRLRPSLLLRWPCVTATKAPDATCERLVIIDTGPDFREQALRAGIRRVDAVFYTHSHADHIMGMDDLRPLSFAMNRESGPIPMYATAETRAVLEHIFEYTFSPDSKYANRAKVVLKDVAGGAEVDGVRFTPVPVLHGALPITGYRFGNTAYLTDVSKIPEASFALLEGLETLIVSALRHVPHPSHATVKQAVEWAERIGARQTWFTHISHDLGHENTNAELPPGMALAHDGLTIPISTIPISAPTTDSARPA
jgi:phosphoribosyl 1,2-cyclic phosphate phosphodiesterase